jgi:hypothetical protein
MTPDEQELKALFDKILTYLRKNPGKRVKDALSPDELKRYHELGRKNPHEVPDSVVLLRERGVDEVTTQGKT